MTSQATYFGANGWLLEIADCRVLVDPWLSGSLVFPPGAWMLRGELPHPWPVPENLDLLLLTQGLADHCHLPSLNLLPRDLPVVGSAAAAKVVKRLGFEQIETLKPDESIHREGSSKSRPQQEQRSPMWKTDTCLIGPVGRCISSPTAFSIQSWPPGLSTP